MNILRLSALVLITVMMIPSGAHAHCDGVKHAGSHPHCSGGGDGGGSDTNVPFAIAVVSHSIATMNSTLYAPASVDPNCLAQSPSIRSLWAGFPRHDLCATLSTNAASIADDVVIKVEVDKKSGGLLNVTSVQVTGQDTIGLEGLFHQSDEITDIYDVISNVDGSFVIHVHADDVTLWKCDTHLLRKKTTCTQNVGTFAIHDMVYTPDP